MESKNIMQVSANTYLKFTSLSNTIFWDFYSLSNKNTISSKYPLIKLKEVLNHRKVFITIDDAKLYKRCRVQVQAKGVVLRDEIIGKEIKTKKQQLCKTDDFLVAEIDAKVGGYGIVPNDLQDAIVSGHYFLFEIDKAKLLPEFLGIVVKQNHFFKQVKSTGSTNYAAIRPSHVLEYQIPLPSLEEQEEIVNEYNAKIHHSQLLKYEANGLERKIEEYLFEKLGIEGSSTTKKEKGLQVVRFESIIEWGLDKILSKSNNNSIHYKLVSISECPRLAIEIFRGKSPLYRDGAKSSILNQKCNRWNEIDLTFVKSVDETWFKSIDAKFFTKTGDILINSTGEGTIGRASYITNEFESLLYDSHILLLRLDKSKIRPEFFVEVFNSKYGQNQVNDIKSAQATKQTELGVSNLTRIYFPLPDSIELQNTIVEHIKRMRRKISELKRQAENDITEAEKDFEKGIFG